jgi:hypothetical protein
MNVIVYQVETEYDGSKSAEPIALFRKMSEAKDYIGHMMAKGKEVYGMMVGPMRVNKI